MVHNSIGGQDRIPRLAVRFFKQGASGVEPVRVAGLTELINDPDLARVRRLAVIDWDTNIVDVLRTVVHAVVRNETRASAIDR